MKSLFSFTFLFLCSLSFSQIHLVPDHVFDGKEMHKNWSVYVVDEKIEQVGPTAKLKVPEDATVIELDGMTLMPGLIEGHSHLLLHPYDETSWNDQVLKESPVERAIRGAVHAKESLMAGITTMRDLGSEGAGYADVELKQTIEKGIIPGPRLLVAGPAIVATGAYGPKGFHAGVSVPLGAEEASGPTETVKAVRRQLGNGADFIKVYADYRWQPGQPSKPTFTQQELNLMVEAATSAGSYVVAHASTPEGMRRAILAGVETIEHGDGGTVEIFKLMKERGVALCPTIAAGDAISRYQGWDGGDATRPERIQKKRESVKLALNEGVQIVFGGDVGVFSHGENVRELELMVEYGMKPIDALRSATAVNAEVMHLDHRGQVKADFLADLIAVEGDPSSNIETMREVKFVMFNGEVVRDQ